MIAVNKKMKRMGATMLSYGRDIKVFQDSKLTDRGMLKFHALPTWAEITVHYADGRNPEKMSKANFEFLSNLEKADRFIYSHFVD